MKFINDQLHITAAYTKTLDPTLIAFSIIIAITSAFTAFGVVERIDSAENKPLKVIWIIFGALSMGLGIWSMHFIGSLALKLPVTITYNRDLTLLSMLPAILVSLMVLWLMMQTAFSMTRLLFCGALLGLGICNMHFIGMLAMDFNGEVLFLMTPFIISLVVAIVFATAALYIQFNASNYSQHHVVGIRQIQSALVMGFAVSGMYYITMQSTVFIPGPVNYSYVEEIDSVTLAYIISAVVFLILLLAIITPLALRYRQMNFALKSQEENSRIAATAFQTHDAIMITDAKARIIRVNDAFVRTTGFSEKEIIGENPRILKSGRHQAIFYAELWNKLLSTGQWGGEVFNKRKNGEHFPVWQTISAVRDQQGNVTHYVSFFSDITEFKNTKQEIARLAFFDPLTDLPNRRLLNDQLGHELAVAKRYQRIGALLFLDLDRFKHINDSLGHTVGDEILKETAKRLVTLLRESDTAIRLGGDEYLILIAAQDKSSAKIMAQAQTVAAKILAEISRPYTVDKHLLHISTSIGISLFTGIEENTETILKQADTAMYQAKDAGRNTYRFYQPSMQEAVDNRLLLEKNLRLACDRDEFALYLQPQISYVSEIIGAEALIRWNHPEQGLICPATFIPVAEETGLIVEIDLWVLQEVCQTLVEFDRIGIHLPHVSINISPRHFYQADFVAMIKQIVDVNGVDHERIILEITEGVFLDNIDEAVAIMSALKQSGFRFSIDDFGTGYSSLTYLKCLPFDQLKIDQFFVRDLINDPYDAEIVRAIIVMAKALGLNLIAEGVETLEHLEFLARHGCNYYQGHYFSKPLPADEFSTFYRKHLQNKDFSKSFKTSRLPVDAN